MARGGRRRDRGGASVAVIVVHHLGYPEYRGPAMRSPVVGCTILSIAYLLTANPLAAIGGHIILHLAMLRRGMELPPHRTDQRWSTARLSRAT